jgi:membrane associated rhomboid family serine protease
LSYQQQYRPSRFGFLPPVVKNILIINVIMYLALLAFEKKYQIDLNDLLGLHYFTSPKFRWYQVITHMFMHQNFAHIAFNMYAVWMFGTSLENFWGAKRFIIFYLFAGLGAAFLHTCYTGYELHAFDTVIAHPDPDGYLKLMSKYVDPTHLQDFYRQWKTTPASPEAISVAAKTLAGIQESITTNTYAVGASGALFGILLAFGMLFPNTELMLIFFPVPIKAKYFVMLYGGVELLTGVSQIPGDNIAHFAHLGGMLFGFILIKLWQKNRTHFY